MTLHDVEQLGQFEAYYRENNLRSTKEKIDDLTQTMKIIATRCDKEETAEDELHGLEELALQGFWRAS